MKQLFITLLFILIILSVFAQSDIKVTYIDTVMGKNLISNSDIHASKYVFPDRINETSLDTVSNLMTIQLRDLTWNEKYLTRTGHILLYDLGNKQVKWSKKLNYSMEKIHQQGDMIIRTQNNTSYCMNYENGEDKWKIQNRIYIVDAKHKIGIGYDTKGFEKPIYTLQGIDLNTGTVLWDKTLSNMFSWDNNHIYKLEGVLHFNDSVPIAVINGLHAMNVKTGKGWDYDAWTGRYDFWWKGNISNQTSNILIDSTDIYWATKDNLTRINRNGNIEWGQPLPGDLTSKSTIFKRDSLLYMVNQGWGISEPKLNDYRQTTEGKPYIASFSLKTGLQKFLTTIGEKKDEINDVKVKKDTVFLAFKNKISKYALKDASLIFEKKLELDSLKELISFVNRLVYLKSDDTFKRLETIDSTNLYIWTGKDKVIEVNATHGVMDVFDAKQFYYLYLQTKDYRFIAKETETIVLDKADKIVATFQASSNAKLIGSRLYDNQKQNLVIIDLTDLIKR